MGYVTPAWPAGGLACPHAAGILGKEGGLVGMVCMLRKKWGVTSQFFLQGFLQEFGLSAKNNRKADCGLASVQLWPAGGTHGVE